MISDTVIIQQANTGSDYVSLMEFSIKRHLRYCRWHGFDFRLNYGDAWSQAGGSWDKVTLIRQAFEDGYHNAIWLDADAMILNIQADLRTACKAPVGVCIYDNPRPHWQVGVMYWRNCDESARMLADWAESAPGLAPWWEQNEFNRLAQDVWPAGWILKLPPDWNSTDFINPCADPVVLATHGYKGIVPRLDVFERAVARWHRKNPMGLP